MPFYRNHIYPRLVSALGDPKPIREVRQRMIPLAQGEVLEIGVGPGVNFVLYDPKKVSKVYALEPNPGMIRLAEQHRRAELNVEFLNLPGERIPLGDGSVDTVVSTFTLCTIPGVADAIRGIGRVLRPGGQFLFFEHGLSPDIRVRATFPHSSRREDSESKGWRLGTWLGFQNQDRIASGASRVQSRNPAWSQKVMSWLSALS